MAKDDRTREEKLNDAYDERAQLQAEMDTVLVEWKKWETKRKTLRNKLIRAGQRIHALKHDGDTPHVTDHAIVRYLERVKGMDISDLKWEVAQHNNAHQVGNVITTILPDRSPELQDKENQ